MSRLFYDLYIILISGIFKLMRNSFVYLGIVQANDFLTLGQIFHSIK